MHTIDITITPPPSDSPLVFNWDTKNKRFERQFYLPKMTDFKISFEQIDQFFTEVDTIVSYGIQKVRRMYCLFLLAAVVLLTCVIATLVSPEGTLGEKAFLVALWILVTVLFSTLVYRFIQKSFRKLKENVENLSHNRDNSFEEQGYYWKFMMKYPGAMELVKGAKGKMIDEELTDMHLTTTKGNLISPQTDRQLSEC